MSLFWIRSGFIRVLLERQVMVVVRLGGGLEKHAS